MTDTEDLKARLAVCLRMLESRGIIDYNGHASIRLPDDTMLINVGSVPRSRLTAADICTVALDGTLIEGHGKPPLELHLHAGLYRARADVKAVVHAHPPFSTALTTAGQPYLPVYAQGSLLSPMPVLDSPDSINSPDRADALAGALGEAPAVLMKAHGAATVGADITEAFTLMNYLEENAERQIRAMQIGTPYRFTEEECRAAREKLWTPSLFQRTWEHFAARLEDGR